MKAVVLVPRTMSSAKIHAQFNPGFKEDLVLLDVGRESTLDPSMYHCDEQGNTPTVLDLVLREIARGRRWCAREVTLVTHKSFYMEQLIAAHVLLSGRDYFVSAEAYATSDFTDLIKGVRKSIRNPEYQFRILVGLVGQLERVGWDGGNSVLSSNLPEVVRYMDAAWEAAPKLAVSETIVGPVVFVEDSTLTEALQSPGYGKAFMAIAYTGPAGVRIYAHKTAILEKFKEALGTHAWQVVGDTIESPGTDPEGEACVLHKMLNTNP